MHQDEPSLLTHLNAVRASALPEGGLSTVIYCGKVQNDSDLSAAIGVHQEIVAEEVNREQVLVTGILMGQVGTYDTRMLRNVNVSIHFFHFIRHRETASFIYWKALVYPFYEY